jgi:hypothetical protein
MWTERWGTFLFALSPVMSHLMLQLSESAILPRSRDTPSLNLAQEPAIMTEISCGFHQSLPASALTAP